MGDQSTGQLWLDIASTTGDVVGFGLGVRAARLFSQAADLNAWRATQPFLRRWSAFFQVASLRLQAGAAWFLGAVIDSYGLAWDGIDSWLTIRGDLQGMRC